jgi:pyridoxamine 5'-phosphate oxidase family protein
MTEPSDGLHAVGISVPELTEAEQAYLATQPLARLATAKPDGRVDVAPVGFRFDGRRIVVGGYDITKTMKFFNVRTNPRVAIVVDDLASTDPWTPRGIKFHGAARIVDDGDGRAAIEITPERKWSWGINRPAFDASGPAQDRS